MTMTFDGFFAGPHGELDWMSQTPDQELNDHMVAFFQGIDRGFIGYPTASGMIPYWLTVAKDPSTSKAERAIAQAVNTLHPLIISRQEEKLEWENTELLVVKSDHDLVEAVNKVSFELVSAKTYKSGVMRICYTMTLSKGEIMMAEHKVNSKVTNKDARSSYASVNGLNLYYEIHGAGEPLILLHGGVGAIEMFGEVLPSLAQNCQVIAVDLQAHGRTSRH